MVNTAPWDDLDCLRVRKLRTCAFFVTCALVVGTCSSSVFRLSPVSSSAVNQLDTRADLVPREEIDGVELARLCSALSTFEKNAGRKLQERASWFEAEIPHERHYFQTAKLDAFAAGFLFSPYYMCPFPMEKSTSVAQHFDGGKWLCGLTELSASKDTPCVAFSFGSNYDLAFENDLNAKRSDSPCDIHIFDPTMAWEGAGHSREKLDKFISELPDNYHFHELGLS